MATYGSKQTLLALITGPLVGALVVSVVQLILDVTRWSLFVTGEFEWIYFLEGIAEKIQQFQYRTGNSILTMPAFVIHLWLGIVPLDVEIGEAALLALSR